MSTRTGRQRLGAAVKAARLAARMSKDAAARAGGISTVSWTRVERGEQSQELTLSGVEVALGWPPGTALAVLDGADPPPIVTDAAVAQGRTVLDLGGIRVVVVGSYPQDKLAELQAFLEDQHTARPGDNPGQPIREGNGP